MSNNESDPYLEHIDGEKHDKANCVIKKKGTKVINGCTFYVHKRKCRCRKHLPRDFFLHRNSQCGYTLFQQENYFIVKEVCYCYTERRTFSR